MEEPLIQLREALENELHQNILTWWLRYAVDHNHGGFIGMVDAKNNPNPQAPKGSVLNARILWTFSAAFRLTEEPTYFETANRAYKYLTDYFIDQQYGGVFWELDYKGSPINQRKQIYALSFAMYGLVEYYKACGEEQALKLAIKQFELIEAHSFDKNQNGYVEALSRDWQPLEDLRLSEKDANESKTMNTHLHILEAYTNLYRVFKNQRFQAALKNLIQLFLNKFIHSNGHLNLFFDDDWNLKGDHISYGHDIECSWLLLEAAEVLGDETLLEKVKRVALIMAGAVLEGMDADGGLFNEKEPASNKLDTDKHWWPQAEALVGFYNAYQLSGEKKWAQLAMKSWAFIKKQIVDEVHGEWFWRVNKAGEPNIEDEKAGFWKCPYHNSRACMELMERIPKEN